MTTKALTKEETEEFIKVENKLRTNNVLIGKFSQDLYNVHVTMCPIRGEDKTLTFAKSGRGSLNDLDDKELGNFCNRNILEYFKNWNGAQIQSFFYNKNWAVDSWKENDTDDCLEKKLQYLEDDGYEIHTILNNRIIGRIKSNKTLW